MCATDWDFPGRLQKPRPEKTNRQALWQRAICCGSASWEDLARRRVVWAEKAEVGMETCQLESDEDFARLVTQAQLVHDANQLFISHADQPADTLAAGCDTVDELTIFD